MSARTRRTAMGSLKPASPSRVLARSGRRREPRRSANTAAPSVPEDRPEQEPFEHGEVEQEGRGEADHGGGSNGPEARERYGGGPERANLCETPRQPPLREKEGQSEA